ncbi:MAG: hypothetical protein U1C74_14755 [Phenylobacterium sp.]|nr:hypothetical protein [Phenylobacterium sp.]
MSKELSNLKATLRGFRRELAEMTETRRAASANSHLQAINKEGLEALDAQSEKLHSQIDLLEGEIRDREADEQASARERADDRTFWFRRFHTSLAIAHGAALAAIASKLLDPGISRTALQVALGPLAVFAVGMILAGLIPYALAREHHVGARRLANVSGGLFVGGLIVTVAALGFFSLTLPDNPPKPAAAHNPTGAAVQARRE